MNEIYLQIIKKKIINLKLKITMIFHHYFMDFMIVVMLYNEISKNCNYII